MFDAYQARGQLVSSLPVSHAGILLVCEIASRAKAEKLGAWNMGQATKNLVVHLKIGEHRMKHLVPSPPLEQCHEEGIQGVFADQLRWIRGANRFGQARDPYGKIVGEADLPSREKRFVRRIAVHSGEG